MYKAGNIVIHPSAGVCRVNDVRSEDFSDTPQLYYVLEPVYENGAKLYTPVDSTKITLRPPLTDRDVYVLIQSAATDEWFWIDDDAKRSSEFQRILKSGDSEKTVELIIGIHRRKDMLQKKGKKLHLADERILREAERLINQEFAYALGISQKEVPTLIQHELKRAADSN